MLTDLKEAVYKANLDLAKSGLVILTFGNVSGIDRRRGIVAIKPSGVPYEAPEGRTTSSSSTSRDRSSRAGSTRPRTRRPTSSSTRPFPRSAASPTPTASTPRCSPRPGGRSPASGTTHADHFHGPVPLTRLLVEAEVAADYERNTGKIIVERFAGLDPLALPARPRRRARAVRLGPDPGRGRRDRRRPRAGGQDGLRHARPRSPPRRPSTAISWRSTSGESTGPTPITDRRRRRTDDEHPQGAARPRRRQPRLLPHRALAQALAPRRRGVPQGRRRDHPHPDRRRERDGRPQGPRGAAGEEGQRPRPLPRQLRARGPDDHPGPEVRRAGHGRRRRRGIRQGPRRRARATPTAACSTTPTTWACASSGPTSRSTPWASRRRSRR